MFGLMAQFSRLTLFDSVSRQIQLTYACVQTRGRKTRPKTTPWWIKPKHRFVRENKTAANVQFLKKVTPEVYAENVEAAKCSSPLKSEPWERGVWQPGSVRTGLLARKIGCLPQWTKTGRRIHCTLLQVLDNHVISYTDPLTWYKTSRVGKKESNKELGRLTIGAVSQSPHEVSPAYRGIFEKAGVLPKEKLASFAITPNAKIEPGTRLFATHFRVGQYVDLWGTTIDHGYQGAMRRWGFAGSGRSHGNTKNHRRTGSVGTREKGCVFVGRKNHGHMGNRWRPLRGLRIVRMNTKYQVLYLHCYGVMGNTGSILYVKDSGLMHRKEANPVFPTHYLEEDKEKDSLPEEYVVEDLFDFRNPTITFEEQDQTKKKVSLSNVKKQAKVKKK